MIERLRRPTTSGIARKTADTHTLTTDLENKMVQLYSKILEYQIRLMRQSSHNWALRYGRDIFKSDEWKTMSSQIQDLDSICSRIAEELGQEELEAGKKESNMKIDNLMQSWNAGLRELHEQGMNTYMALNTHASEDRSWREREDLRRLLQALRAKNPYRDQMERTATRQAGTCNWFLKHSYFQTWRKDVSSRLLWVSANPGCGKSVLSKCLVEEKLATLDPQHATVCYFFFKDVSPDSRSITKALSAILHQLFTNIPGLVEHALPAFDENGDEVSSMFSTLWEILENAAADPMAGEIVCVIDALDECEEIQQIILIEKLKTFYSKTKDTQMRKQNLRFLLTSRPYRNIRSRFHSLLRDFPTIHLSGDDESDLIKEEIDLVIRSEVSAIASERCFDSETEDYLLKQLLNIENRTYLWLQLILDQIRNSDNAGNKKAIRKEIQTIPQSVSKAYERILAKTKDKPLATKLLHIIVGAEAALTLEELNVAMAIEDESKCYKDLELESAKAFELRIKIICGLFIYIDRSRVFLIHQTAKEFLEWNQQVSEPPADVWQHSLKPEESNSLLARICVSLLMFDDFETNPLSAEGLDSHLSTLQQERYCDSHVFLRYAAEWWIEHLGSSPVEHQIALLQATAQLCDVSSRRCWTWLRLKRFPETVYQPAGFTNLILACDLDLVALVSHLLAKGVDVNARDKEGATALNRAVRGGNVEMARTLLQNGADIEAGDWDTPWVSQRDSSFSEHEAKEFSDRPLMMATMSDDHNMMQELLAAGADPNAPASCGWFDGLNPLHYAIITGCVFGEDPENSPPPTIRSKYACSCGLTGLHEQKMRILLDHKANVNARVETRGRLQGKARQLLLEVNCNIDGPMNALGIAVEKNDAAKVSLLLDYGADAQAEILLDDEDNKTQASLHPNNTGSTTSVAVSEKDGQDNPEGPTPGDGNERVSTSGSSRSGSSNAALGIDSERAIAISDGEVLVRPTFDGKLPPREIVEEWEQTTQAISKMTLFHFAASRGIIDVVQLFLQHGASKRAISVESAEPTALHLAALLGSDQVVRMILDQTIDVNPRDHKGATPLHHAVWCGYDRIVNELLEHGADTNAKNKTGTTPLHVAVVMGYDLVAKDLLDYGADIHVEDNEGVTSHQLALREGVDHGIKRLLEEYSLRQTKMKM